MVKAKAVQNFPKVAMNKLSKTQTSATLLATFLLGRIFYELKRAVELVTRTTSLHDTEPRRIFIFRTGAGTHIVELGKCNYRLRTMSSSAAQSFDDGVVIDEQNQKAELTASPDELRQLLKVMEDDILPITEQGVVAGNKVFGAAILDANFKTVLASTNAETECPLFHGEVKCIYEWSKITAASERGAAAQRSIFLATHEPCCMCISSILWSGFQKVYYFFPYTVTTAQGIPHDINTMHELWGVSTYRKRNKYLSTICIIDVIESLPEGPEKSEMKETITRLFEKYDELSDKYHSEKANNENNSLVLG